jgi:hypothetical protein
MEELKSLLGGEVFSESMGRVAELLKAVGSASR